MYDDEQRDFEFPGDIVGPVIQYKHRPAPSGLHAKLVRELRDVAAARYSVDIDHSGRPGYVNVFDCEIRVWQGHRDSLPLQYRGARDPFNVLSTPDSSD